MTSIEALERYYSNLKYGCGGFQNDDEELEALMVIKQDLERLEKLEKFVDIYKHTNQRFILLVQAPYSDLPNPTMEQELIRLEVLEDYEI